MAIIVDVVIIAVLVIFVIVGVKRGFLLTLFPLIAITIAIVLGLVLRAPVRSLLDKTDWEGKIETSVTALVQQGLDKMAEKAEEQASEEISEEISEEMKEEAAKDSSLPEYISNRIIKWLTNAEENAFGKDADTAGIIGAKAASLIMDLIAFLMIAVVVIIATIIIKLIIKSTRQLNIPVLHQLDSVGGGILGFVLGAAVIYGLAFLLGVLASCGYLTSFADTVRKSLLGGFVYNHNPIGALIALIKSKV